jgi:hypothetical protein
MTSIIGYLGYALINLWSPLQIIHMVRGRHIELGRLPVATLVGGLVCLQVSFGLDHLPLYTQVGNAMGLVFSAAILSIISLRLREKRNAA